MKQYSEEVSMVHLGMARFPAVRVAAFMFLAVLMGCSSTGEVKTIDAPVQTGHEILRREKMQLARLYMRLGEIYYQDLGDEERSREYFLKYLEMVPTGEEADLARKRLGAIKGGSAGTETKPVALPVPKKQSGTIILFWRSVTPRTIQLMEEIQHLKEDGWGEEFRILHAIKDPLEDQAAYLEGRGFDMQLVDDSHGELASRWGVDEYPGLVVLDAGDQVLKRFWNWDGSGLRELLTDIPSKTE